MNKTYYLTSDSEFIVRDEAIPAPGTGEVVVKTVVNSICGSDLRFYRDGKLGKNSLDTPEIFGHECAGVISAVGEGVEELSVGQRVIIEPGLICGKCRLCREGRYNICENLKFACSPDKGGTFREYLSVRAEMIHPMPDQMSFELGAMVEPLSVALHAVRRAGEIRGKSLAVLGAGPIGLFVMHAFRASGGGSVTMIDKNVDRLNIAKRLGADFVLNPDSDGPLHDVADIVIEAAGYPATVAMLPALTLKGGTMVQIGWPNDKVLMDIFEFNNKELTYRGAVDYNGEFATSIYWLANNRVDGNSMITHRFSFDQLPEAFSFASSHPQEVIKAICIRE